MPFVLNYFPVFSSRFEAAFDGPLSFPDGRRFVVAQWALSTRAEGVFFAVIDAELQDARDGEPWGFKVYFHQHALEVGLVSEAVKSLHLAGRVEIWNYLDSQRQELPLSRGGKVVPLIVGEPEPRLHDGNF